MMTSIGDLPISMVERFGPRLDEVANRLAPLGERLGTGQVKDLLSGTWQGHPLHPVLTDATIGAWTSAVLLDLVGGERSGPAARKLVGLGVLSAGPTALTGWSDWVDVGNRRQRRVGVAHALGNSAATVVFGASWLARRRGHRGLGITLGMLGAGVASVTASLGGHLVYREGVGVNVTAFDTLPTRYQAVMDADDLQDGTPTLVHVNHVPVMVLKRGEQVTAMHDGCTHRGGPLHKGTVEGNTVVCPWHGSCFRLADGGIERGPATAPQPTYRARIRDGKVEVHG
jgi:nitrite reductase/ring-hydroxylating ferredoxin subunit/uncharacterized membrane protein